MKISSVHSLVAAGLCLVAGCYCLFLQEDVLAASLLSFALGLFGKAPLARQ